MTTTPVSGSPVRADIRAAAGVNDSILAIGRILIALIFVSSGIEKFMDLGATASAIGSKGLPYPNILAVLTAILEAGGGLLIIVGWQTRLRPWPSSSSAPSRPITSMTSGIRPARSTPTT
jgi:hypothetical protein